MPGRAGVDLTLAPRADSNDYSGLWVALSSMRGLRCRGRSTRKCSVIPARPQGMGTIATRRPMLGGADVRARLIASALSVFAVLAGAVAWVLNAPAFDNWLRCTPGFPTWPVLTMRSPSHCDRTNA